MFQYNPVGGHTQISSLSGVQPIAVPAGAAGILIQALTQNVRITMDGSDPATGRGFEIKAGDPAIFIAAPPGTVIKAIQETASASIEWQAVMPVQFGAPLRTG